MLQTYSPFSKVAVKLTFATPMNYCFFPSKVEKEQRCMRRLMGGWCLWQSLCLWASGCGLWAAAAAAASGLRLPGSHRHLPAPPSGEPCGEG
jgi:hypothetical protein